MKSSSSSATLRPRSRGGPPARSTWLPCSAQQVDERDIAAVNAVLRSPWLTTGPQVAAFECAFADAVGAAHAVAVSSGTAALHAALAAAGIGPGNEVILPPITFAATANVIVHRGATPVFADVCPETLLIDVDRVAGAVTPRTRAIIAVDYAGQPCDYDALREIAERHGLVLIADACHAAGADDRGRPAGNLADLSAFSFHPVKPLACGEGGMVTTDCAERAAAMRRFRNHGIDADHHERAAEGTWSYDVLEAGFNYRLSDIHCALGLSQLGRLRAGVERRRTIAATYDAHFAGRPGIEPLATRAGVGHAQHLYVVQVHAEVLGIDRDGLFAALREQNIGSNVHYKPVHLHTFYRKRFGHGPGLCPVAERAAARILSLPCFAAMTDEDAADVIEAIEQAVAS